MSGLSMISAVAGIVLIGGIAWILKPQQPQSMILSLCMLSLWFLLIAMIERAAR